MEKQSIKTFQEFNEENFIKKVIFNNGTSTAFVLNFMPGQKLPAHKHPGAEVFLLVAEGSGTITIDGKETEVTENDLIHTGEEEELAFANTSSKRVSLYVILNKFSNMKN